MDAQLPEYLLFSEATGGIAGIPATRDGWRFVLQSADGLVRLEADDREPDARGERLELLAVVRGLEALDQRSYVTLVTTSRYVRQGLVSGLGEWRENAWQWDRYGQLVAVKNADLWQRVDRALAFHTLICRTWRLDEPAEAVPARIRDGQRWPVIRNRLRQALARLAPRRQFATTATA